MLTVAYLANQFPVEVEPYVGDEIAALERRGVRVVAASLRGGAFAEARRSADVVLLPLSAPDIFHGLWLCLRRYVRLMPLLRRVVFQGSEPRTQRCKAFVHTFLGAFLAARLRDEKVEHIHVHHGYFGSWVGMTTARLLGAGFSFTLHGSDLLLDAAYLDTKLAECEFCITVSEFNRRFICEKHPAARDKVLVSRLGVDVPAVFRTQYGTPTQNCLKIVAVGRLHAVKDHSFLVRACARLAETGISFNCWIAGEGSERQTLESLIRELGLGDRIHLLGHVRHEDVGALYERADVVVLTSRSEGIPLVLMEAMATRRIVLAPRITGVPELVIEGKTGFLYRPGDMDDFVSHLLQVKTLLAEEDANSAESQQTVGPLAALRNAARDHVLANFNRTKNLNHFADLFLSRVTPRTEKIADENLVLQQIQPSI